MTREPKPDRFTFRRLLVKVLLVCTGTTRSQPTRPAPFRSIIILAQEKLGDAILMTPLPCLIKAANPESIIHVVTFGKNRDFYEADPHIDQVFVVKPRVAATLREIRQQCYNVLINTKDHPSFSFLLLTRLIRADFKLGIDHPYHRGFFHRLIPINFHTHVDEKNCAFLPALGIPFDRADMRPQLPPVAPSASIAEYAARLRTYPRPLIGINLSAGESDREYPAERWLQVMTRLPDARIVILGMKEKLAVRMLLEQAVPSCVPSPKTATLFDVAAVIEELDLLITPDTSLIHVCSCLSVPIVALFRSQRNHISHFSPYHTPHRLVISPTMRISDIPIDEVAHAAADLLAECTKNG